MPGVALLKETPCSITYEDVTPHINRIADIFERKYGCPREDSIAELGVTFVKAYRDYDPKQGPFDNYFYFMGYKHLLESVRLGARREAKLPRSPIDLETISTEANFNLVDFMDELSPDAKRVVDLALNAPRYIAEELQEKSNQPRAIRAIIRAHLIFVGWSRDRIRTTFDEIKTVLGAW
jgi:hypothetical protein